MDEKAVPGGGAAAEPVDRGPPGGASFPVDETCHRCKLAVHQATTLTKGDGNVIVLCPECWIFIKAVINNPRELEFKFDSAKECPRTEIECNGYRCCENFSYEDTGIWCRSCLGDYNPVDWL